jgi:hypothetical protein
VPRLTIKAAKIKTREALKKQKTAFLGCLFTRFFGVVF